MKKIFFIATLLFANFASAGKIKELLIMAEDSIIEQLYSQGDNTLSFSNQHLLSNSQGQPQIKMDVTSRNAHNGRLTQYSCTVDFVATPSFFEVAETNCQ